MLVAVQAQVAGTAGPPPAAAVWTAQARDRVRAAILNSGLRWPDGPVRVGLQPPVAAAGGGWADLAAALAVLAADGQVPAQPLDALVVLGELGLDGTVRPVRGALPCAVAAADAGMRRLLVAQANAAEAALATGAQQVVGVPSLAAAVAWLRGEPATVSTHAGTAAGTAAAVGRGTAAATDLADAGWLHPAGRRALEIAAAGGHHLRLTGPHDSGKTMLAQLLPGLLPPLTHSEAMQVTSIHCLAGELPAQTLIGRPPLRQPHHTTSLPALVGRGGINACPGEVSLAHHGVLLLHDAPQFGAALLQALQQPLESGEIVIARAGEPVRYPAQFQLVLTATPCPCAAARNGQDCTGTSQALARYAARLPAPLLDRIDLHVQLPPATPAGMAGPAEPSAAVARRIAAARQAAAARLHHTGCRLNARVPAQEISGRWSPPPAARRAADQALDLGQVSPRGHRQILRVAWTIADLAGHPTPTATDVDEAVGMRIPTPAANMMDPGRQGEQDTDSR